MPTTDPERFLPLKAAHFHLLLTLTAGPVHGYGIRREVEERTNGRIVLAAGTLYETLQRLGRQGLLEEVNTPPRVEPKPSSRWRFYQATAMGKQVVRAELARLEADVVAARARLA